MASGQVETKEEHPAPAPLKVKAAGDTEDVTANKEIVNPEQLIKHPLQNKWALWYYKNDKNKDWASNLRLITAFDTVEDFWGLYNHVQPASKLSPGCDYSMFKEGIQPMWEDDRNKKGGRWLINLDKRQRNTELDRFWLETSHSDIDTCLLLQNLFPFQLLCLIGEAFDDVSEYVCGAVVNIRHKGDKLGLWTGDAEKPEATMKIGKKLKERLNVPPKLSIGYQAHTDTMVKSGSTAKNRFVV